MTRVTTLICPFVLVVFSFSFLTPPNASAFDSTDFETALMLASSGEVKKGFELAVRSGRPMSEDIQCAFDYIDTLVEIATQHSSQLDVKILNEAIRTANKIRNKGVCDGTQDPRLGLQFMEVASRLGHATKDHPSVAASFLVAVGGIAANLEKNPAFPKTDHILLANSYFDEAVGHAIRKDGDLAMDALHQAFSNGFTDIGSIAQEKRFRSLGNFADIKKMVIEHSIALKSKNAKSTVHVAKKLAPKKSFVGKKMSTGSLGVAKESLKVPVTKVPEASKQIASNSVKKKAVPVAKTPTSKISTPKPPVENTPDLKQPPGKLPAKKVVTKKPAVTELQRWARKSVAEFQPFTYTFDVSGLNGKRVSSSDFQGEFLVVDLWATWCEPCRRALPHFSHLQSDFKNVKVVGISVDHPADPERTRGNVSAFVEKTKPGFPIGLGDMTVKTQVPGQHSLPLTLFIDTLGNVRYISRGYQDYEKIKAITAELVRVKN